MTSADREEFAKTLFAMAAACDFEVDEAITEGFWMTLNDLPLDRVKAAVITLLRTSKFRPKAAEIREIVVEQMQKELKASQREDRIRQSYAVVIATDVVRSQRRTGADDNAIREALRIKGAQLGMQLYWPGEEPWNNEPRPDRPKLELKRA